MLAFSRWFVENGECEVALLSFDGNDFVFFDVFFFNFKVFYKFEQGKPMKFQNNAKKILYMTTYKYTSSFVRQQILRKGFAIALH